MIDYERFMRQQLKKLNPVQQVAYSLIKGDARFISTLIDISKEPSKADNKLYDDESAIYRIVCEWRRTVGAKGWITFCTKL